MDTTMAHNAMTPFLHFTPGDYLLFEAWKPSSAGAVAGASIGLVCLAIFNRWLAAVRVALDYHWRRKSLATTPTRHGYSPTPQSIDNSDIPLYDKTDSEGTNQLEHPRSAQRVNSTFTRTIPPFVLAHDLPRGIFHAGQALLGYILMLSVMTFNSAYIISVVVGLAIGETLFGRMGSGRAH